MFKVNKLTTPVFRQHAFFKRQLSLVSIESNKLERRSGDNLLHHIIRHNDMRSFYALLQGLNESHIAKLARVTNNEGHIPLSMVDSFIQNDKHAVNIKNALLKIMLLRDEVKRLDEKISGPMILSLSDTPLQRHIKLSHIIANQVRSILKASATHPDTNEYEQEDRLYIEHTQYFYLHDKCFRKLNFLFE